MCWSKNCEQAGLQVADAGAVFEFHGRVLSQRGAANRSAIAECSAQRCPGRRAACLRSQCNRLNRGGIAACTPLHDGRDGRGSHPESDERRDAWLRSDGSEHAMQLSRIDLNLFTVFDAIYREGGITPASKRLHLSQPAVSHALGRLRELLDDPLFERRGNEMIADAARAHAGGLPFVNSLGSLEQMLQRAGQFDPASSRASFTIAVRESQEVAFLPDAAGAPDAGGAEHRPRDGAHRAARSRRRSAERRDSTWRSTWRCRSRLKCAANALASEPLVVLARAGHPVVQGALDLETYLALEHMLVTGQTPRRRI